MAKRPTASQRAQKKRPANWQRVHDQSYKTVPLSHSEAMALLSSKGEQALSGRFLLKGEDATIDIRDGELYCLMKGRVLASGHPFARFVRAYKDEFLELYEGLKENGLEIALITGRFLKNGPNGKPLFASYVMVVFVKGYTKFLNVFRPMFEWEQHAFPTQLATITCLDTDPEALAADIADAHSQMMKLIGNNPMFESTYWFADDVRFQVS